MCKCGQFLSVLWVVLAVVWSAEKKFTVLTADYSAMCCMTADCEADTQL